MLAPEGVLILGLGGGSCAKLIKKYWQYAKITGIDFDKKIVELGKKYLSLSDVNAEIIVDDAFEFVEKAVKEKRIYDLIIVDLYVGREYPVIFEGDIFVENIKKILNQKGIVIFNRLYFGEKRPQTAKFGRKLEKYFSNVEYFYPEANVMLICRK
jgi:spermidine synthase